MYMYGSSSAFPTRDMSFFNQNANLGNLAENYFTDFVSGGIMVPNTNYTSSSLNLGGTPYYEVWDLFNVTSSNSNYTSNFGLAFFTGSGPGVTDINSSNVTSSYYVIPSSGSFTVQYGFNIDVEGQPGAQFTGSMEIWLSSSLNGSFNQVLNRNSQSLSISSGVYNASVYYWDQNISNPSIYEIQLTGVPLTLYNGYTVNEYDGIGATCGTTPTRTTVLTADQTYLQYTPYNTITGVYYYNLAFYMDMNESVSTQNWQSNSTKKYSSVQTCSGASTVSSLIYANNFTVDTQDPTYNIGDKLVFRFLVTTVSSGGNEITKVALSPYLDNLQFNVFGNLSSLTNPSFIKVTPSNSSLILANPSVCVDQTNNAFYLPPNFSAFYGANYYFDPLNVATSASFATLYDEYGYIGYPFILEPNDKIIIQIEGANGYAFEYTVQSIFFTGNGSLYLTVIEDISGYFANLLCNKFYKVVFLKRLPDETNIIINLTKPQGKTSYGFVLPSNISKTLLDNIDAVTKNSKQQLIDAGSNVIV